MNSDNDWKKPVFKNWIRGVKGLEHLQKGLQNDVARLVFCHLKTIIQKIVSSAPGLPRECNLCTATNLLPEHARLTDCRHNCIQYPPVDCFGFRKKNRRVCPNGLCSKLYDEIVRAHRFKNPKWKNTDISTWFTDPAGWSFAKCFQTTLSPGKSSSETDAAGLLSIILNDTVFQNEVACNLALPNNYFSVARDIRNILLHSQKMELDDTDLQDYINNFIAVLQDRMFRDDMSSEAVQNLVQLQKTEITISLSEEIKLVQVKMEALQDLEQFQKKEQEVVTNPEIQSQESLIKIKRAKLSASEEIDKGQIHQRLKQTEEAILNLQNTISQMNKEKENERSVTDSASAKLENEYTQKKTDLQTRLCDYYKRCLSSIPVSPVLRTISGTVDEVFVELSFRTNVPDKDDNEEFNQVNLYRDILYKDNTLCKNVYLLGEAGMGKTTWCKKFLNTWVKACSSSKSSGNKNGQTADTDDDIHCLQQFGFVFYVALRQVPQQGLITDMINCHTVVKEFSMQTVVEDVLRSEPESCIILLDGLDEWEPHENDEIPSREGLHGCIVVTTSRKYRLVGMEEVDNVYHPIRIVEMTGIRNKELLVKNVVKQLNSVMKKKNKKTDYDSSEDDSNHFIRDVKKMKDREISYQETLPGYLDNPLMLIVMVCLWFDRGKIEDTITKNIGGMIEFIIRYAEGFQQSVLKKKIRSTGKLESIKNLDEMKKEWSKHGKTLPPQLRQKDTLVSYSGLILKVSEFAFDSLFNTEKKIRLVFSQTELLKYFSEDELHVIMKIGLLSQSEVTESFLSPMTKLSFIHKLFHEYLAGVFLTIQFLSSSDKMLNTVEMLEKYFKDPVENNLSNIDNAACFVGGIDPIAGSNMSKKLFSVISPVYNAHAVYFNTFFLRQVQVVHENDAKYPSQKFPIYTNFISVPKNLEKGKMKYLHMHLKTNINHLMLIEAPMDIAHAILENLKDEKISEELSICFYDFIPNTELVSLNNSLQCVPELQNLELRGPSKDFAEREIHVRLDLTHTRLKKLELKGFSNMTILVKTFTDVLCDDDTQYKIEFQNVE